MKVVGKVEYKKNLGVKLKHNFTSTMSEKNIEIKAEEGVNLPEITVNQPSNRLASLDGLRGLTIILMITANYQTIEPFSQLEHAELIGFSIADAIFPTFILIMGLAVPLAIGKLEFSLNLLWKTFRRSCLLWLIGAFLNGFSLFYSFENYRVTGILQRLAICYFIISLLFITCRGNSVIQRGYLYFGFPLGALIIWFSITYGLYVPGCGYGKLTEECSAEGYLDTKIWGIKRNHNEANYDPEGFLSTFTATVTCWMGLMIGIILVEIRPSLSQETVKYRFITQLIIVSLGMMFLAYALYPFLPISKNLYTPSFTLLAGGCSLASFSTLIYLFDIKYISSCSFCFLRIPSLSLIVIGRNPLLIYFLSELLHEIIDIVSLSWSGAHQVNGYASLWLIIYDTVFYSWLPNNLASLLMSQVFIWGLFVPLAWVLDKKSWYLRV